MLYKSTSSRPDYFPPILGNGRISFGADCQGAFDFTSRDFPLYCFNGALFHAGRRLGSTHDCIDGQIMSFGMLSFSAGSKPEEWEQELVCEKGYQRSLCSYADGKIASEYFILADENLYCLKKTAVSGSAKLCYTYNFRGYDEASDKAIFSCETVKEENGAEFKFFCLGQDNVTGSLRVFTDRDCSVEVSHETRSVKLELELKAGESCTLFLAIDDDMMGKDGHAETERLKSLALEQGFEALKARNAELWAAYYAKGYVKTDSEAINNSFMTCLYHLKCYTTRWSIPVGMNDIAWDGRYFAFDEYYSYLGLLGANQIELASRVPHFRLEKCLQKAIKRMGNAGGSMARFAWETSEYGEEMAPDGPWIDHFFHMALVAVGAYEYYEHSCDREFLDKCYPMIRACALFYTRFLLYRDSNGSIYVGKCTDLERLGEAVENPFMTACGVIKTLETLVKASELLGTDEEYRAECAEKARLLRLSLPEEEGRFVPYLGCPKKSIGVFAGKFPYDVISEDDSRLFAAWDDFIASESVYGNMYSGGSKVSPWYCCWKAEGYARSKLADKAYACTLQALESFGAFGEAFEINEPGKRTIPWFTTTAGIYLSTVNEMLLQSDGESIYLLPAYPGKDCSFKLSAKGGAVVEAVIENDEIKKLEITPKKNCEGKNFKVYLKGRFVCEASI